MKAILYMLIDKCMAKWENHTN